VVLEADGRGSGSFTPTLARPNWFDAVGVLPAAESNQYHCNGGLIHPAQRAPGSDRRGGGEYFWRVRGHSGSTVPMPRGRVAASLFTPAPLTGAGWGAGGLAGLVGVWGQW
jgi:hypothetical protein